MTEANDIYLFFDGRAALVRMDSHDDDRGRLIPFEVARSLFPCALS